MAIVQTVNLGEGRVLRPGGRPTGIGKQPTAEAVPVRAPGPKGTGSGLVGDAVCDGRSHGGDDQAVYAYAREDMDTWQRLLGRALTNGSFGENLTTLGVEVTGALIGERWQIGEELVLEVSTPRIPCGTFRTWMGEPHWVARFTDHGAPGTYLRVVTPGWVRGGDTLTVIHRPDHDVSVGLVFRALTTRPELLPTIAAADALPEHEKARVRAARSRELDEDLA